jgi:HK97 family phage major capsid protein
MSKNQRLKQAIKAEPLCRSAFVERAPSTDDDRTVDLSFSSEEPYQRWFGWEILDHAPQSVNMKRLNTGAAVRDTHQGDQVAVVEKAWIGEDRKGRATVRFSKGARASEILQDIRDGIRRNVSVRYAVNKMQLEKTEGEMETYRVIDWEPIHISIEPDPADTTVGVGRSAGDDQAREIEIVNTETQNENRNNTEKTTMPDANQIDVNEVQNKARNDERARVREIDAACAKFPQFRELAEKAKTEGTPADQFRCQLVEALGATPVPVKTPEIGMSPKEVRQYSLVRALRILGEKRELDGLEAEASRAVAKLVGRSPQGFFVPFDVQNRALNVTTAADGGNLVATNLLGSSMIELLRNRQVLTTMGARQLGGLVGDVAIPRVTGGATAYWLAETAEVTESTPQLGQLALTPHRLAALTKFSKQLLAQSSVDVEALVRDDIVTVLAIAKDLAAINGSGSGGQPTGIINTSNIGTVTFGGAPTWAKVVEFETDVAAANALAGNLGYVTTAAVMGKWKTVEKATGTARFLWEGPALDGEVNGHRAMVSQQVPSNKVIFGNFNDLIVADWDGLDVVVDPYTLAANGQVRIVITLMSDVGVRHAASFSVSTDAGQQ